MTSAPDWSTVRPGDWIRAVTLDGTCHHQGVVESISEHAEYGLVMSVNDTRRAAKNWNLLEVRPA